MVINRKILYFMHTINKAKNYHKTVNTWVYHYQQPVVFFSKRLLSRITKTAIIFNQLPFQCTLKVYTLKLFFRTQQNFVYQNSVILLPKFGKVDSVKFTEISSYRLVEIAGISAMTRGDQLWWSNSNYRTIRSRLCKTWKRYFIHRC